MGFLGKDLINSILTGLDLFEVQMLWILMATAKLNCIMFLLAG